jgi:hypothetical protein
MLEVRFDIRAEPLEMPNLVKQRRGNDENLFRFNKRHGASFRPVFRLEAL